MKKVFITVLICSICLFCICYIEFNIYKLISTKSKSEQLLQQAYDLVESTAIEETRNNIVKGSLVDKIKPQNSENLEQNDEIKLVQTTKEEVISNDDIIGVLLIPKLNIEAPIKDGTSQKIMQTCVGHFTESDYWDGNVSFASHNSGISAHYFSKINLLNKNDEIIYKTRLGTKKYKVQSIDKIESTDWSMVVGNNNISKSDGQIKNTITLVTCINRLPKYRLCVRGVEVKE